jgi:hypothetical protein
MELDTKTWSLWLGGFLAFAILCASGKSCNDSDNELKMKAIEKGCSYASNGVFICSPRTP